MLQKELSYDILAHWTRKAELQITIGKLEEATSTIEEIGEPLLNRGYQEEVIRLARRLFAEVDWAESCAAYKDFDAVLERCLTAMVQVGHPATEALLERYEQAMPGKGAQYILLCDLRCYAYWYSERYDLAIHWGERGAKLKDASAVDTAFSTKHNLALSLRDGGRVAHALEMFLDGEALEVVTRPGERVAGRGAHFYGNVGRCLFVAGKPARCKVRPMRLIVLSPSLRRVWLFFVERFFAYS